MLSVVCTDISEYMHMKDNKKQFNSGEAPRWTVSSRFPGSWVSPGNSRPSGGPRRKGRAAPDHLPREKSRLRQGRPRSGHAPSGPAAPQPRQAPPQGTLEPRAAPSPLTETTVEQYLVGLRRPRLSAPLPQPYERQDILRVPSPWNGSDPSPGGTFESVEKTESSLYEVLPAGPFSIMFVYAMHQLDFQRNIVPKEEYPVL
ncbi:uncharacterized protein LOC115947782 [Geospiza fortis]|uniref:Uncharacterized protein LOC115947782 n=1 Tax=Geospiza fortis TaxID=48883 RepID=A0A8N5EH85_GEOFO|nr:uncharacterized protein LOC115947782 [Geospiza fortis]